MTMSALMVALAAAAVGHGVVLAIAYRPEARRMFGLGLASGAMLLTTAGVLWFGLGR